MCKIYVDFDGVLVNTPKYIKQEIKKNGNLESTFINIKWHELLSKCSQICDNLSYIKKIYKNADITILTHIYSQKEKEEKIKYIRKYIGDINIVLVPYTERKSECVNSKDNLLIDDYNDNIENWINKGGVGCLFKNNAKLEDILSLYLEDVNVI